jgi:signal transduction histidine kinase
MRRLLFRGSTGAVTNAINWWLTVLYGVALLASALQLGLSFPVAATVLALLLVHVGASWLSQRDGLAHSLAYAALLVEFALLLALHRDRGSELSGTVFLIYTVVVVLNYPAWVAFPLVISGYLSYLMLIERRPLGVGAYLPSLLNFMLLPLSVFGIRLLIAQRQRILELNQRLQSQAELAAEMTSLRERNRLAEAMHDTIGHTLTAAIVSLEGVSLLLEKRPAEAVSLLDSVREQLQTGLGDLRQTVRGLRTDGLAEQGELRESLEQLVARVGRQTSVSIELHYQVEAELLPIQEYVLYTTAREGLTNALKHSRATVVQVRIKETAQRTIALVVADNGEGAKLLEPGFGLSHLEQKVTALGGVFSIDTREGGGFRLSVLMPLALDGAREPLGQPAPKVGRDD